MSNSADPSPRNEGALHVPISKGPAGQIGPIVGTVAQQIGTGDNAQNAIVYRTIIWCFVVGGLLSGASFVYAFVKESATPMAGVKDIWAIFAPIVTLALGYIFGKGR